MRDGGLANTAFFKSLLHVEMFVVGICWEESAGLKALGQALGGD